ncbi:hypothetical protein J3U88_20420 [Acanthopleuribacter pedis]|uniref:General secretion pathway GspH domain-containing protein n=1 Tax=Acanthopleuribacter pedis TaxID=442870 RepID=A0A8J7QIB9_9BACT|nr:hypothetical protein [Acanthopleuribacter pedis]
MIELMVVTTIIGIITAAGLYFTSGIISRNALVNEVRMLRTAFIRAKSDAIVNKAPVRFTYDRDERSVLAVLDMNRTGDFVDPITIVQHPPEGAARNTLAVIQLNADPDLNHYTGLDLPLTPFEDNEFLILPDGRILSGAANTPGSGTFIFEIENQDIRGALHITAKGETKIAFKYGANSDWDWIE